jgi:hypothetical protein
MTIGGWVRACLLLAVLKVVMGLIVFTVGPTPPESASSRPIPRSVYVPTVLVFGAAGGLLIYGSHADRRGFYLGAGFLLIASSFSDPLLRLPGVSSRFFASSANPLAYLHPDAFLPCFFWLFFRDFPRSLSGSRQHGLAGAAIRSSLVIGAALFLANAASMFPLLADSSSSGRLLQSLERSAKPSYYWSILFALTVPTVPFALWNSRQSNPQERRRLAIFLGGLAAGFLPMMFAVLLEVFLPPFAAKMSDPAARSLGGWILYPLLLSIPITTAYSVMVDHVLDVRLIVRKALQYALARFTALALAAFPFLALIVYTYNHRDETVTRLLSGGGVYALVGMTIAAMLVFRLRRRVFDAIDRRFFREQYDSRQILASLVEKSRLASNAEEMAFFLQSEIERALHLESVAVLILDSRKDQFRSPQQIVRPLPTSSLLAMMVGGSAEALDIDLEDPRSMRLPTEDRRWLAEAAIRLIVSLIASDGSLVGMIALGEKRSELPFSKEDRLLLMAIAASVAMSLENRLFRATEYRNRPYALEVASIREEESGEDRELALECQDCRTLLPPGSSSCTGCRGAVASTTVPYILLGKFRLVRRVGSGGMGVVYSAIDLALGRTVAVKTLPRVSPEHSMRLRREARAMAAVVHPNLALIYGAETWRGTPMLIVEYLDGGTLADRLKYAPLSPRGALQLGIIVADVLERTHAERILHRDIKPSNIGYTRAEVPKLLDFGLARVLADSRTQGERTDRAAAISLDATTSGPVSNLRSMTVTGNIVGTPLYLSPECIARQRPDPSFDLWALTVVLYEAIAGRNPVERGTVKETLDYISRAAIPDIRQTVSGCPENVALFFADALAKDRSRRPQSAAELRSRLKRLNSAL